MVSTMFAQRTIQGRISENTGEGLIGATVLVQGTSIGTATDMDGNYSLQVPENASTLIFSYTGFQTQVIEIGVSNVIDVVMLADYVTINEIVVLGYSTQSRDQVTGSAVQLSSEKLSQLPLASVDQALQGNVAGLQLNSTSGTPGSVQNILIRGRSSITASNSPLFVIDGVPVHTTIHEPKKGVFSVLASGSRIGEKKPGY